VTGLYPEGTPSPLLLWNCETVEILSGDIEGLGSALSATLLLHPLQWSSSPWHAMYQPYLSAEIRTLPIIGIVYYFEAVGICLYQCIAVVFQSVPLPSLSWFSLQTD